MVNDGTMQAFVLLMYQNGTLIQDGRIEKGSFVRVLEMQCTVSQGQRYVAWTFVHAIHTISVHLSTQHPLKAEFAVSAMFEPWHTRSCVWCSVFLCF